MDSDREIILEGSPILSKVEKAIREENIRIVYQYNDPAIIIIALFREQIRAAILEVNGRTSRSNWTYQIAFAMMIAAKTTNHILRFESEGKRDAIIEDQPDEDGKSEAVLAAEWEWESQDVFGPGKEIEKLYKTLKKHRFCDGLLITYVLEDQFPNFVREVQQEWTNLIVSDRNAEDLPLYVCVVSFTGSNSTRVFQEIQTFSLRGDKEILFWEGLPLSEVKSKNRTHK